MDGYEIEESVGRAHLDRLSKLPESLILRILSLLPMRDVVSTAFLSKSWENLWTTVPCLNFCESSEDYVGAERFRNFVNGVLILWEGTQILKFEIDTQSCFDMLLASHMNLWVRFAVKNKVEELNIYVCCDGDDVYKAPRCLSSCSSVRKLSLVGCSLEIHGSPAWNQLKCLKMNDFCFSEHLISQILLGAPQLEVFDLHLLEINENLSIESASLKKLSVQKGLYNHEEPSLVAVLKICCPNLETLEISGVVYAKCLLSNFSSLADATLGFHELSYNDARSELLAGTLRQILPSIQHVETLGLSTWCVEVLVASLKKFLLSPLLNVKFLKLGVDGGIDGLVIVNLLGIFPNVKMLVIEDWFYHPLIEYGSKLSDCLHNIPFVENAPDCYANNFLEFETSLSKSVLGQLKIIDISSYFSHASIFQFIAFLLKHACKIEKLVIRASFVIECGRASCPQMCFFEAAKVVLNMPRSSPTAKVVFKTD